MNISGINSAVNSFNKAASNISADKGSLSKNIVQTMVSEKELKANASVIKTQDEMLGTIVDLKA